MDENKYKNDKKTKGELIPLSVAAKLSGYTPEHLNLLSRKGTLQAKKIGRNWHTTREWLDEFIAAADYGKKGKGEKKPGAAVLESEEEKDSVREAETAFETEPAFKADQKNETGVAVGYRETFQEALEKKIKAGKSIWIQMIAAALSLVVIIPVVFATKYFLANSQKKYGLQILAEKYPASEIINENYETEMEESKILGMVKGEETTGEVSEGEKRGVILASENFKINQVSLGGIIMAETQSDEYAPLEILDIRSESFIDSKKNEARILVSWKTNKLAISKIEYSKNSGQNLKTIEEKSYGFNHSVILSGLDPRTSYVYQVKGRDHWGNEKASNLFVVYTASKAESVFDLISKAMDEVFGWAVGN